MFRKIGLFIVCGLLSAPSVHAVLADPDLPGAAANLEVIPAGSLIIPMDNVHQLTNDAAREEFNIAAYGLANKLLQNNIPIKWAIRSDKVKLRRTTTAASVTQLIDSSQDFTTNGVKVGDLVTNVSNNMLRSRVTAIVNATTLNVAGVGGDAVNFGNGAVYIIDGYDFTATASRIRPSAVASAPVTFTSGPFIVANVGNNVAKAKEIMLGIDDGVPPALPQFNATAAQSAVRVYETVGPTNDVDVRYTLTHKPFAAISDVKTSIHTDVMVEAGIPGAAACTPLPGQPGFNPNACNWNVINPVQLSNIECATIHMEPHRDEEENDQVPSDLTTAVNNFVQGGGNFIAQCHSVQYFENDDLATKVPGNFLSTQGMLDIGNKNEQRFPNGPMPFNQFTGPLDGNQGGSVPDFSINGGAFKNNGYANAVEVGNNNVFKATTAKLPTGSGIGGVVMYLGGHEYKKDDEQGQINGRRMLLNAMFIPPDRPQNCGLTINATLILQKRVVNDSGGALGGNDFGVTTSAPGFTGFGAGVADGANTLLYTSNEMTVTAGELVTFSENDTAGYDEGSWTCTSELNDDTGGGSFGNGSATLQPGDTKTCVITNNDSLPNINLSKTAGTVTPLGGYTFQLVYTITATNNGDGSGTYDLSDTLNGLPTGVTVSSGPVAAYLGGETQTQSIGAFPLFIDDEPLGAGASESWSVTVEFMVDPDALADDERACDGNSGSGFYNAVATIPDENPDDNDACADVPLPSINLAKSAGTPTPLGGNAFEVVYTVTATNSGDGPGIYDLHDMFNGLPTGVTVTNGPVVAYDGGEVQTKSVGASPLFVDDEPLGGNASESWTITVEFTVDPGTLAAGDRVCDPQGASGKGFYNFVTAIAGEDPSDNDACANIPGPSINLEKTSGDPTPISGYVFEVVYTITATNSGDGPGTYDINDSFSGLPTGVTVTSGPVVAYGGGETQTKSVGASPLFVDDEPLAGGASESWTVTVQFTVDPIALAPEDGECAEFDPFTGKGFYNLVTAIAGEDDSDNHACEDVPTPNINLEKSAGAPTPLGGYSFQVVYTVTATNSGDGPGIYDLSDTFSGLPSGVSVTSGPVVAYAGGEMQTQSVGASPLFVDDEPLGGNSSESWTVTVEFTVDPETLADDERECDEQGASGAGFYNVVASIPDEDPSDNDACSDIPAPSINLAKTVGDPTSLGNGVFQVVYTVTATNSGDGPGIYDLSDTFNGLPAGVTVSSGPVVAYAGGEIQTKSVGASPLFVDDEPLGGNASESWTLTVEFTVDPNTLEEANIPCDPTGQPGKGFYNFVDAIPGEDTSDNDACIAPPPVRAAQLQVNKEITNVVNNGDDTFDVSYKLTVANLGDLSEDYDLRDTLEIDSSLTVTSVVAPVAYLNISDSLSGSVENPDVADFIAGNTLIIQGESLAGNSGEAYTFTLRFTLETESWTEEGANCTFEDGEEGTGFTNNALLYVNEQLVDENSDCAIIPEPPEADARATFTVQKAFMDGNNETEATFRIDCNTGLILDQVKTTHINPGELYSRDNYEVEFVVTDFTQGNLTCEVWEDPVVPGYTPTYDCDSNTLATCDSGDPSDLDDYFEGPCVFSNVDMSEIGEDPWEHLCVIRNYPDPVPVVVNKVWVLEGAAGLEIDPWYKLILSCDNEIITEGAYYDNKSGKWVIKFINESGDSDAEYMAYVIPYWDGGTNCSVYEFGQDQSVEVDNGCGNIVAKLADGDECTITNTVFFEGIPTLNQYGLILMALLMLGMGFVGFRRFV